MNALPYRPNVCMLVVNREYKLFLGERYGESGVWQFPQGGEEPGLTREENVLKELEEELGADPSDFEIISQLKATYHYDFATPPAYAVGRWRGQQQTFWLVRYLPQEDGLKLDRYEPEFMSYRWCTAAEVRELAEPKRLKGYEQPLNEYEAYLRSITG